MLGLLNTNKLASAVQRIAPIKNALKTAQAAANPTAYLQQMANGNPQIQEALKLVQNANGDARAAFYSLAQQLGINGDDVLGMLK